MPTPSEASKVIARYKRRDAPDLYCFLRPEVLLSMQERQRATVRLLVKHATKPIRELRVLEIGCGYGGNMLELLRMGFAPENLVANELIPERAAEARRNLPMATTVHEGDAADLTLTPESFDIVLQSTVFTSLLDYIFQVRLAALMWRWTRPSGGVLWYDFVYNNPNNPDVVAMPLGKIRRLFPNGTIDAHRITLAPPISRQVCRLHPNLYGAFNLFPFLRTHLLCWVGKAADSRL